MIFEGFGMMILNYLRIPPGTSLRKSGESTSTILSPEVTDLVNSIVDITVDDVCLGSSPIYYSNAKELPPLFKGKVDLIITELNSIIKWAAVDILKQGYSVYAASKSKENNLLLFPVLGELEFFLDPEKKVHVFEVDGDDDKSIKDVLVFINYDKEALNEIDDDERDPVRRKFTFQLTPSPIQLKNIATISKDLATTERAMQRYRKQTSKMVRFLSVDVGVSMGDNKDAVIESISAAVNADSGSITPTGVNEDFDDSIPVIPNRRGAGKPELIESTQSFEIGKMADLDYNLSKLYLALRFPKSYADFSNAIDQTAVSTIRGDIRYSRLIDATRTLLMDTVNNFLATATELKKYGPLVSITELPTPEDEDVIAAMETFTDFSDSMFAYVIEGTENKEQAKLKFEVFQKLLGGVASFKYIQDWIVLFNEYIDVYYDDSSEAVEGPDGISKSGAPDKGGFDPEKTTDEPDFDLDVKDKFPDAVEEIESQTEG